MDHLVIRIRSRLRTEIANVVAGHQTLAAVAASHMLALRNVLRAESGHGCAVSAALQVDTRRRVLAVSSRNAHVLPCRAWWWAGAVRSRPGRSHHVLANIHCTTALLEQPSALTRLTTLLFLDSSRQHAPHIAPAVVASQTTSGAAQSCDMVPPLSPLAAAVYLLFSSGAARVA